MKVDQTNSNVETLGLGEVYNFEISNDPWVYSLLSKQVYNNPVEAVLREVYSNAVDASKNGIIKVQLPTETNGYILSIEDDGPGMDENQLKVFTTYGMSTKRNSNEAIGGLGIGAKSPFGYTDQFIVESSKNGIKRTLLCFKNEDGKPSGTITNVEKSDVSGTKVSVKFKNKDYYDFYDAAGKVFLFSKYFPTFDEESKATFEKEVLDVDKYLAIREEAKGDYLPSNNLIYGKLLVEMGGVYYVVNTDIFSDTPFKTLVYTSYSKRTIVLHANIGDLDFQASRESLRETEKTKKKLVELLTASFDRLVTSFIKNIENGDYALVSKQRSLVDGYYIEETLSKLDATLNKQYKEATEKLRVYYSMFEDNVFAYNSSFHTEKVSYKTFMDRVYQKNPNHKQIVIIGTSERAPNSLMENILRTNDFDEVMYTDCETLEPSLFDKYISIDEAKKTYKLNNKQKKEKEVIELQDKNLFWKFNWNFKKVRYSYNELVALMKDRKVYVLDETANVDPFIKRQMEEIGTLVFAKANTLKKLDCSCFNNIKEDMKTKFESMKDDCIFWTKRLVGFNLKNINQINVDNLTNEKLRKDILAQREFSNKKASHARVHDSDIRDYYFWAGKKDVKIEEVNLNDRYPAVYENLKESASPKVIETVLNELYA